MGEKQKAERSACAKGLWWEGKTENKVSKKHMCSRTHKSLGKV